MADKQKLQFSLYFMEAWGLGIFMVSACLFTILIEHPDVWVVHLIPSAFVRRVLIGIAMGSTAMGIIYSPWGKKSGAHMNPAVTLTMAVLKNISITDMFFYMLFQTLGGTAGVMIVYLFFPSYLVHPSVNYIVTIPGNAGVAAAFTGEIIISFLLMLMTRLCSNSDRLKQLTGVFSAFLIACFVTFEAPFSGFSMNPARTVASAWVAGIWTEGWIYFTAPPLGMMSAAGVYYLFLERKSRYI